MADTNKSRRTSPRLRRRSIVSKRRPRPQMAQQTRRASQRLTVWLPTAARAQALRTPRPRSQTVFATSLSRTRPTARTPLETARATHQNGGNQLLPLAFAGGVGRHQPKLHLGHSEVRQILQLVYLLSIALVLQQAGAKIPVLHASRNSCAKYRYYPMPPYSLQCLDALEEGIFHQCVIPAHQIFHPLHLCILVEPFCFHFRLPPH